MYKFSMRAKHRDRAFKMVRGEIKGMSEARGEDMFCSRFEAINSFTHAVRAWRYRPQGLTFEVHEEKAE